MVSGTLSGIDCDDKDQKMRETLALMASMFIEERKQLTTSVTEAVTATMNARFLEEKEELTATMNARFLEEKEELTALFKEEVSKLNERVEELEVFKRKYDNMSHTLSSREVGNKADIVAMDLIFPGCRKEVYQIRSLNNLVAFMGNNPNGIKFCETAIQARDNLSFQEKKEIEDRIKKIDEEHPKLLSSIKLLKGRWELAHTILYEIEDSTKYYDDVSDDIADAVKTCWSFYEHVQGKKMYENKIL